MLSQIYLGQDFEHSTLFCRTILFHKPPSEINHLVNIKQNSVQSSAKSYRLVADDDTSFLLISNKLMYG